MKQPDHPSHAQLLPGFEQIRLRFIEELDDRILDIEALKRMILNGDREQEALAEIISRAHKIRGVAGTLGLGDLGDAASRLENRYIELFQSQRPQQATFSDRWSLLAPYLETLLDQMECALES